MSYAKEKQVVSIGGLGAGLESTERNPSLRASISTPRSIGVRTGGFLNSSSKAFRGVGAVFREALEDASSLVLGSGSSVKATSTELRTNTRVSVPNGQVQTALKRAAQNPHGVAPPRSPWNEPPVDGDPATVTALRELTFWKNGFSIEDGELMRYDEPSNAKILEEINAGRAPTSAFNVLPGQPLEVRVSKRTTEDYLAVLHVTFWRDGISVEDGDLILTDQPNYEQVLADIGLGRAPPSIPKFLPGQKVRISVSERRGEDYIPPRHTN